jgi:FeS assembly SUF system protein
MTPRTTPLGMSRLTGQADEPSAPVIQGADATLPDARGADASPLAEPVELTPEQVQGLEKEIVAVLHTCFDPEVPVNIYELGLIYGIDVQPTGAVTVRMTLTSPACPVAGSLPGEVESKVRRLPNVTAVQVELVWDPPWHMSRMSEAAKLQLGLEDF